MTLKTLLAGTAALALVVASQPMGLAPAFAQSGGATIGDQVWIDVDGNAMFDAPSEGGSDRLLRNVRVTLLQNGVPVAETVTGADGRYEFTNVAPGEGYTLEFDISEAQYPDGEEAGSFSFLDPDGQLTVAGDNDAAEDAENDQIGRVGPFSVGAGGEVFADAGVVDCLETPDAPACAGLALFPLGAAAGGTLPVVLFGLGGAAAITGIAVGLSSSGDSSVNGPVNTTNN